MFGGELGEVGILANRELGHDRVWKTLGEWGPSAAANVVALGGEAVGMMGGPVPSIGYTKATILAIAYVRRERLCGLDSPGETRRDQLTSTPGDSSVGQSAR